MPAATDQEFIQNIEYNQFFSPRYNVDFEGKGQLRINPETDTFTFSGTRRRGGSSSNEIVFQTEDIRNVGLINNVIRFTTPLGNSGRKEKPFVFFLPDAPTAKEIAGLLPVTRDEIFLEGQDFAGRLNATSGPHPKGLSVTKVILGLNVLVFTIMGLLGAGWIETKSIMPYILYGANNGAATTDGEWWRLVTSAFMHFGILHLALNMWALFAAGSFLERILGKRCFTLTYLAAGIAGSLASIGWNGDQVWSAGASGAVFGVFGALLGFVIRQKQAIPKSVYQSMLKSSLSFAGYNIVFGFLVPGIDNAAHMGGLAGGFFFAWLLALPLDRQVRNSQTGRRLQIGAVALAGLIAVGISTTPRYDYRVQDEIAWQNANEGFGERNAGIEHKINRTLSMLGNGTSPDEMINLIETEVLPFYSDWRAAIAALPLNPGKRTYQNQQHMLGVFDLQLKAYQQLAHDLRASNPDAMLRFEAVFGNTDPSHSDSG